MWSNAAKKAITYAIKGNVYIVLVRSKNEKILYSFDGLDSFMQEPKIAVAFSEDAESAEVVKAYFVAENLNLSWNRIRDEYSTENATILTHVWNFDGLRLILKHQKSLNSW